MGTGDTDTQVPFEKVTRPVALLPQLPHQPLLKRAPSLPKETGSCSELYLPDKGDKRPEARSLGASDEPKSSVRIRKSHEEAAPTPQPQPLLSLRKPE